MRTERPIRTLAATTIMFVALAAAGALSSATTAQEIARPEDVVQITPALPKTGFEPGATFQAAVVLDIMEGYHLNAHATSDPTLIPTQLKLPKDSPVAWPYVRYPEDQAKPDEEVPGLHGEQYYHQVIIRLVGRLPADAEPGEIKLDMKVYYQTCNESLCLMPIDKPFEFVIPVVAPGTEVKDINEHLFGKPGG
jgi:thiol:disulfide interchange protein DsbD